jgi:hypothetical protein
MSIIAAGTTTTTALSSTGNTDGTLQFQVNGTTASVTLNTLGAIGVGSTPAFGNSGQVLTSGGSTVAPTWTTPTVYASTSTANTWTATQTFNGTSSTFGSVFLNIAETAVVTASAPASTQNLQFYAGAVLYFTSNAANNWVANLTFNSGVTTLNTALATGQSATYAMLVTNGGTAYYNTSVQVDGTTSGVTTKWQGGTAPTAGNASAIDVYTYTVIKTGSATFTVLASQTKFA